MMAQWTKHLSCSCDLGSPAPTGSTAYTTGTQHKALPQYVKLREFKEDPALTTSDLHLHTYMCACTHICMHTTNIQENSPCPW